MSFTHSPSLDPTQNSNNSNVTNATTPAAGQIAVPATIAKYRFAGSINPVITEPPAISAKKPVISLHASSF